MILTESLNSAWVKVDKYTLLYHTVLKWTSIFQFFLSFKIFFQQWDDSKIKFSTVKNGHQPVSIILAHFSANFSTRKGSEGDFDKKIDFNECENTHLYVSHHFFHQTWILKFFQWGTINFNCTFKFSIFKNAYRHIITWASALFHEQTDHFLSEPAQEMRGLLKKWCSCSKSDVSA